MTANVAPSNATGQIEFLDGTTPVGVGTLNATGQAQITTTLLASGTRPLVARYGGAPGVWGSSQSNVVNQVVHSLAGSGFTAAASPGTGSGPDSVAIGDFNGDGGADLAVANGGNNNLSILPGQR